jgi:hypothetical protein
METLTFEMDLNDNELKTQYFHRVINFRLITDIICFIFKDYYLLKKKQK